MHITTLQLIWYCTFLLFLVQVGHYFCLKLYSLSNFLRCKICMSCCQLVFLISIWSFCTQLILSFGPSVCFYSFVIFLDTLLYRFFYILFCRSTKLALALCFSPNLLSVNNNTFDLRNSYCGKLYMTA